MCLGWYMDYNKRQATSQNIGRSGIFKRSRAVRLRSTLIDTQACTWDGPSSEFARSHWETVRRYHARSERKSPFHHFCSSRRFPSRPGKLFRILSGIDIICCAATLNNVSIRFLILHVTNFLVFVHTINVQWRTIIIIEAYVFQSLANIRIL